MYGGKIDSTGNVSSQLWVFHIQNQTWVLLSPQVTQEQYAVVGHSAHVVPPVQTDSSPTMLVLFGHCPLYGYISQVQEYDIGKTGDVTCGAKKMSLKVPEKVILHQSVCLRCFPPLPKRRKSKKSKLISRLASLLTQLLFCVDFSVFQPRTRGPCRTRTGR